MPPLTRSRAACRHQSSHGTMTPASTRVRAALLPWGACLLLLAGCYGPMYNQPYGYPTYPGQPGSPYYPGGTVAPGGTMLGPGTPTFDSNSGSSGGNAPPFNSGSSGSGSTDTSNRPVPEYRDPVGGSPYYTEPKGAGGQAGAGSPERIGNRPGELEPNPATGGGGGSGTTLDFGTEGTNERFEPPIDPNASPISFQRDVTAVDPRYGYDPDGHDWLQGIVSFDPQDRCWSIVYSLNPDPADPYAGYLTLAQDPRFEVLRDGDVVRVEGQVDPVARDQTGRAVYLVSQLSPAGR